MNMQDFRFRLLYRPKPLRSDLRTVSCSVSNLAFSLIHCDDVKYVAGYGEGHILYIKVLDTSHHHEDLDDSLTVPDDLQEPLNESGRAAYAIIDAVENEICLWKFCENLR